MKTIETKMTVSELREALKASRAKVRLHFTAKGNPAWKCFYRYGKNDREIGTYRLTKKEANEYLAEFGLTANLVVEIEKAIDEAQAAKTAAMKESGELYTGGRDCHKLTNDEINAVYAKFAAADAEPEKEQTEMKTNEIKIETRISANGAAIIYVNGERTSNDKAVEIAMENGLPTYKATCYTYSQSNNSIDETLATALSAYKWLCAKGKGNRNVADGSWEIERLTDHKVIYEIDERDEKINADDEPEFETFIYAKNGAEHIKNRYDRMINFFNQLVKDGLTEEQAEQVITVFAENTGARKHCELIKKFKAANGIVEKVSKPDAGEDTNGEFGITVIGQNGAKVNVRPDCKIITVHNELYVAGNILGIYDTQDEAEQAAKNIKAAIQNGAGEYHVDGCEVDEAEIVKFEVGKTYAEEKSVLRKHQFTITVIKRTPKFVTFQFDDDEEDIRRRKVTCEYGVENIYIHEPNSLGGDYDFNATNVVDNATAETEQTADTVNLDETIEINGETVKFVNGKFYSVFSRKYHGAIVKTNGIYSYCVFNDGDTEICDVRGHEVGYDEFMQIMTERGDEPKPPTTTDTLDDTDAVNREFDKAVKDSIENCGATLKINGETLTFEGGKVIEVGSTRYGAYFTIRNGRKIFYYRGNRVSKQDFFERIAVEDKAADERAVIAKFVAKFGGSEVKPVINPQGKFVAQIHAVLTNERKDDYAATFDTKADAHAFIAEFKALAGDMKFLATIKRGNFYGETIYRHGLNGQEFFTTDTDTGAEIGTNVDIRGFTDEDFLSELTVTLDINAAVEKILATADNFRYLSQRHEIALTKPDSEVMWERDFRGYKDGKSFLVTEVYNHPNGTLREVWMRKNELSTLPVITVQIGDLTPDDAKAEPAQAYDESAFELLPTVDELNDADTGLPLADGEVEYMGDAQAILVATFIDGTSEGKCFETADAAIAFARDCEKNSLVKRGYVMGDDKHYGNEVIYEFKRANATASEKSDVEIAEILTDILLEKISPWSPHMELTLQNGKKAISTPRTAIVKPNWHGEGFVFITPWDEIYARYDTPAQVAKVIGKLKACVVCKIPRFTYPTVDELTAPENEKARLC